LQSTVDVEIELALPRVRAFALVAQRLELAAQRGDFGLDLIEIAGELDQALVLEHALDADQPRFEIRHLEVNRIIGRRQRAASRAADHEHDSHNPSFHRFDLSIIR
jgi:hypothetical protein